MLAEAGQLAAANNVWTFTYDAYCERGNAKDQANACTERHTRKKDVNKGRDQPVLELALIVSQTECISRPWSDLRVSTVL